MPDAIGIGSLLLSGSPFRNCSVHVAVEAHAVDSKKVIVLDPRRLLHHLVSPSVPDTAKTQAKIKD
jgi:hypothetical protein